MSETFSLAPLRSCSLAPLRVALPKGRLLQPCLELFQDLGCAGIMGMLSSRRLLWEEPEQGLIHPWAPELLHKP